MLLHQSGQRVLHANDRLVLDLNFLLSGLAVLGPRASSLEIELGLLAGCLAFKDLGVGRGGWEARLDDVKEGHLELRVGFALLYEELVCLVALDLVHGQCVDERSFYLPDGMLHLASLLYACDMNFLNYDY